MTLHSIPRAGGVSHRPGHRIIGSARPARSGPGVPDPSSTSTSSAVATDSRRAPDDCGGDPVCTRCADPAADGEHGPGTGGRPARAYRAYRVDPDLDLADAGMSTVEYAVGTVVAAAFAAVLYKIVTGDSVVAGLTALVRSALDTAF